MSQESHAKRYEKESVVDEIGRVELPEKLCRKHNICEEDTMRVRVKEDELILKKSDTECFFCCQPHAEILFRGRAICLQCQENMIKMLD